MFGLVAMACASERAPAKREPTYFVIRAHAVTCETTQTRRLADGEVELPGRVSSSVVGDECEFACAIVEARVHCWGIGEEGQLGDGVLSDKGRGPVRVEGVIGAIDLVADHVSVCALLRAGSVICWGSLNALAIRQPVADPWPTPAKLSGAIAIAASEIQTCAVAKDAVSCWGGQISDETGLLMSTWGVTPVPGTDGATEIRRGRQFEMCARFADRPDRCWWSTPAPPSYVR